MKWSAPLNNLCPITKYTVKWVKSSGGEEQEATATGTTYNITGLVPCTQYNIMVIAYTEKGPGRNSDTVTMTTDIDGKLLAYYPDTL